MSLLAARVAFQFLAAEPEGPADAPVPEGEGGQEHTALPKKGPGRDILRKQLELMLKLLDDGNHGGFKGALDNLTSLFKRVDDNHAERWTPKTVEVGSRRAAEEAEAVNWEEVDDHEWSDDDQEELESLLQKAMQAGMTAGELATIWKMLGGAPAGTATAGTGSSATAASYRYRMGPARTAGIMDSVFRTLKSLKDDLGHEAEKAGEEEPKPGDKEGEHPIWDVLKKVGDVLALVEQVRKAIPQK